MNLNEFISLDHLPVENQMKANVSSLLHGTRFCETAVSIYSHKKLHGHVYYK